MQAKKFTIAALSIALGSMVGSAALACEQHTSSVQTLPAVVAPACGTVVVPTTEVQTVAPLVERTELMVSPAPSLSLGTMILGLNHQDRLHDMMDQVDLGASRGWLSGDQVTALRAEHDRLMSLIRDRQSDGLTMDEVNDIELQLNVFSQTIVGNLNAFDRPIAVEVLPM
jgi:hypothetical protein